MMSAQVETNLPEPELAIKAQEKEAVLIGDEREIPAKEEKRSDERDMKKERAASRSKSRTRSHSRSQSIKSRSRSRSKSRSRSRSHGRTRRSRRDPSRSPRRRSYSPSPKRSSKRHGRSRSPPSDPKPGPVLGVFGLSLRTRERDLEDLFYDYGCKYVTIIYDHKTDRSRGFGFAYFKETDGAFKAKERTNGMELHGRYIRVDFSTTKRPHSPTPGQYMGRRRRSSYRSSRYGSPHSSRRSHRSRSYSRSRSRSVSRRSRSRSRSYSR